MIMTIENKRRELFEAWALSVGVSITIARQNYMFANGVQVKAGEYFPETIMEWRAFNAALDAVVIELPEGESLSKRMTGFQQEGAPKLICVDDCRAAIESTGLGLKVLP